MLPDHEVQELARRNDGHSSRLVTPLRSKYVPTFLAHPLSFLVSQCKSWTSLCTSGSVSDILMATTDRLDPQTTKQALIDALNEHRINTVGELRRVECILATLGSPDLTQPMTAAC